MSKLFKIIFERATAIGILSPRACEQSNSHSFFVYFPLFSHPVATHLVYYDSSHAENIFSSIFPSSCYTSCVQRWFTCREYIFLYFPIQLLHILYTTIVHMQRIYFPLFSHPVATHLIYYDSSHAENIFSSIFPSSCYTSCILR
jgi:hypothetical protein